MIKRNMVIQMVAISIVFLFLISGFSALTYGTQTPNNSTYSSFENKAPRTLLNNINDNKQPVNPFSLYSKEPAPMGIADYGIGPNGQPYKYETNSFLSTAKISSLIAYNSSTKGYGYNISFQLNVMLTFNNSGNQYVYWVQEGPNVNTQDNNVSMWVNIFNVSSSSSEMNNSMVSGNGRVYNGTYIFNDPTPGSGNFVNMSYPYTLKYIVNASESPNGNPEVKFFYNDGFGWINFDTVIFTFADNMKSVPSFLVDGFNYVPNGYMFYDAEWIVAGFGNGEQVEAIKSNLSMQLEYWNGHNYQEITNAYDFGSDTAEGMSNVVSSVASYSENGSIFESVLNGSGQLSQVYNQSDIGIVNISSSLSSGYLMVNNTKYNFIDGDVNITIAPGAYSFNLYSSSGSLIKKWSEVIHAGEYLALSTLNVYQVTFMENGLPTEKVWYVNLSNGQTFPSTTDTITFTEPNGTYSYAVETNISGGSGIRYVVSQPSGAITVNAASTNVNVSYARQYYLTVIANFSNGGSVLPSSGWYNAGLSATLSAVANSSFEFVSWTGSGNGSYSGIKDQISITINGPITEKANFVEIYQVTFTETGLPSLTTWYINLTNGKSFDSSTNTAATYLSNGSYSYNIATTDKEYSALGGTIIVDGTDLAINVKFNLVTYVITFNENGLSSGTSWSVTLNGSTETSSNGTVIFIEQNGTYSYNISAIAGYRTATYSGTINVNGNHVADTVTWTVISYPLMVTETGIPNGIAWSATVTGTTFNGQHINVTLTSTTDEITFNEPNGSYSYKIQLPSGYTGNTKGNITVTGQSVTSQVKAEQPYNYTDIEVIATVIIIIAIIGVVLAMRRNRN